MRPIAWSTLLSFAPCAACSGTEASFFSVDLLPREDSRMWLSDTSGRSFVLDSGTPRTSLHPDVFGLPPDTFLERPVPTADWSDRAGFNDGLAPLVIVLEHHPIPGDGIIGMDLLERRRFTWAPMEGRISFGEEEESRWSLPIERRGPGRTCFDVDRCVDHGPARPLVRIRVEGVELIAMIDTGSRELLLARDAFDARFWEDRPSRRLITRTGLGSGFTRAATVELAGIVMKDVRMRIMEGSEALARLRVETGLQVDALLGASVLSSFRTEFDFGAGEMAFVGVEPGLHTISNFIGISFGGTADGDCMRITQLIEGLDADQQGLLVGDCAIAFDRYDPREAGAVERFFGDVTRRPTGTRIPIVLRRQDAEITLQIAVEPFLPAAEEPTIAFVE